MVCARVLIALLISVFVVSCGGSSTPQNATGGSGPLIKAEKLPESDPAVPAEAASAQRIIS